MERVLSVNSKRANKCPQNKKKHPLKVVYITNPIKFTTTASEFRALVQELTGQDAAVKPDAEDGVHAPEKEKVGQPSNGEAEQEGSDPSAIGSYDDDFFCPETIESLQGFVGSNLVEVLTSLDAM